MELPALHLPGMKLILLLDHGVLEGADLFLRVSEGRLQAGHGRLLHRQLHLGRKAHVRDGVVTVIPHRQRWPLFQQQTSNLESLQLGLLAVPQSLHDLVFAL